MSFELQAILYGWVALTSLGDLSGPTIYNATNSRRQITAEDVIPVVVGTHERALATQNGTAPSYQVFPPSHVRAWVTTNLSGGYTNETVTNAIGWHVDRQMLVDDDPAISNLAPCYVDTNNFNLTNYAIPMLTVTGVWDALAIGDGTNQFMRTPCWTNQMSTNWLVNYSSYWPDASVAIQINYTSFYQQTVNYAYTRTNTLTAHYDTNGFVAYYTTNWFPVFTNKSDWSNEVVTVTNDATYGSYPWQIYPEDLQERYKVLNTLHKTAPTTTNSGIANWYGKGYGLGYVSSYDDAAAQYAYLTNADQGFQQTCLIRWYSNTTYWSTHPAGEDEQESTWESVLQSQSLAVTLTPPTVVTNVAVVEYSGPIVSDDVLGEYEAVPGLPGQWDDSGGGWRISEQGDPPKWFINAWINEMAWEESTSHGATPAGLYDPVPDTRTTGTVEVTYAVVPSGWPDPSGTYTGPIDGPWTLGDWTASGDGTNRYISTNSDSPPSPSWSLAGTNVAGTYATINGTGLYGTVYVTLNNEYADEWVSHQYTYTWTNAPGGTSTTIYYRCKLNKTAWDNGCLMNTSVEHRVDYYAWATKPGTGSSNYWNTEGLGVVESNWSNVGAGDWNNDLVDPLRFGEPVDVPPDNLSASEVPTNAGASASSGFTATFQAIVDWRFSYCTNRYW